MVIAKFDLIQSVYILAFAGRPQELEKQSDAKATAQPNTSRRSLAALT
jgi:hypothetical protein